MNRSLRLTEIRVVPLWHLVSDSNSVPVKAIFFGQFIANLSWGLALARNPRPITSPTGCC